MALAGEIMPKVNRRDVEVALRRSEIIEKALGLRHIGVVVGKEFRKTAKKRLRDQGSFSSGVMSNFYRQ